jgi:hypothetical protein
MSQTQTLTLPKRIYRSVCNIPIFRTLRTRSRRRGLVILVIGSLALFAWAIVTEASRWPLAASALPAVISLLAIGTATYGLADRSIGSLDEQQRHMRLSLFSDPFAAGAVIGMAGGVGSMIAVERGYDLLGAPIVALVFAVPALVMAWKLPDELVDDE